MNEQKETILVVDDEEKNVKLLEAMLLPRGYEILKAYDGEDGLQKAQTQSPDLILLDIMMPIMDGFTVCQKLKGDPATQLIPIVIMTALDQLEDRVKGIEAGADDFLTKPFNNEELIARIQTSLRLKSAIEKKLNLLELAREHLARFVPQSVREIIEENPDSPDLVKKDEDLSALFLDVTGYTKLSESMRQTADFMIERYFSNYIDCIHENGGDITGSAGDDLMVVFVDKDPNVHARNAVRAAIEIMRKTNELNVQLKGIIEPITLHVGINSGVASIGPTKFEGSSGARWTYTALGPAIILAARISALAEGGMILIGPETARRVEGNFSTREIGKQRMKNVKEEIMVYEVIDDAAE